MKGSFRAVQYRVSKWNVYRLERRKGSRSRPEQGKRVRSNATRTGGRLRRRIFVRDGVTWPNAWRTVVSDGRVCRVWSVR
jgi:hypothetical protein